MSDEAIERTETLKRVEAIVADVLIAPDLQLTESTTARDVAGWDSLTHVQIIIAIEQAFGIRMTSTEVARLENAGSLVDVILHHKARAKGA